MTEQFLDIAFTPLLDGPLLWAALALAVITTGIAGLSRARGAPWRGLAILLFVLLLLGPSITIEKRQTKPDIAVVIVDETASQKIGGRPAQTEAALEHLKSQSAEWPDVELRVATVRDSTLEAGGDRSGSQLFTAIAEATADVPRKQLAGIIMLTDGQAHDMPANDPAPDGASPPPKTPGAPLHVLLTGDKNARDRRLILEESPRFGIVGQDAEARLRLEDQAGGDPVALTVKRNGEMIIETVIRPGESLPLDLPIVRRGGNMFEMTVAVPPEDIAPANNQVFLPVNGVRERLRVLLISGEPYAGARVWRNFLKSDPSVDLVHFTILRPPSKQDTTPQDELSLISFPIRELFEVKLKEFDLIVFDRYWRRGMLSADYLQNVADYVHDGGALLEATGPYSATSLSLGRGALRGVLPGHATGRVMAGGFRPRLTTLGDMHPVTRDLDQTADPQKDGEPDWGRWFRQIEAEVNRGDILMRGLEDAPLLTLDRIGEGRAAQLMSDHVWLWARGYEGGGPHGELLRRLAHWLMKEPELEENALTARAEGGRLMIERRRTRTGEAEILLTGPSGESRKVTLKEEKPGLARAVVEVAAPGLYRLANDGLEIMAIVGDDQSPEFSDLRPTAEKLEPVVEASGGGLYWLADSDAPTLKRVDPDQAAAGRPGDDAWIGLRRNNAYLVSGVKQVPALPALIAALIACALLGQAWRRESA